MLPPPEEAAVLDQIIRWAQAQETVRAVLLTSTRAVPGARLDPFSDFDVILYLSAPEFLEKDDRWLESFGTPLVRLYDETFEEGVRRAMRMVVYETGLKIDFTLAPLEALTQIGEELPKELDAGYRVLLDKDGLASRLPPPTYRAYKPRPPQQAEFTALVEEFWWDSTYVAKYLWRDELWPAKYSLEKVMNHDLLCRMLEWKAALEHGWDVKFGVHGKGLKKSLDAADWREFEATFAGAGIEANWTALWRTIALFERVAAEVAAGLGLEYPVELGERMKRYLRAVEGTPHA